MAKFIADDFASIARGLANLEAGIEPADADEASDERRWYCGECDEMLDEDCVTHHQQRRPPAIIARCNGCSRIVHRHCPTCNNRGWLWQSRRSNPWQVCPDCNNPAGMRQP